MAGNYGHNMDRMPLICTAGKVFEDPLTRQTVKQCLTEYRVDEAIDTLKRNAHITKEEYKEPQHKPPIDNKNLYRTNTEISGILKPGVRTRYQILLDELEESVHDSYWNKEVGKQYDPTPALPRGMIPVLEKFGIKSNLTEKAELVVNPPKTPYEVLTESQKAHEMYVKTHGDYNPSEKLHRNYWCPPYDCCKRFGRRYNYDYRGIWVKCACAWHIEKPYLHTSKSVADYAARTRYPLGKPIEPNKIKDQMPKDKVFGKPTDRPMYGVAEILKGANYHPCMFLRDMHSWVQMVNKLRMLVYGRISKGYLYLRDFEKTLVHYDDDKSGLMTQDKFYGLCEKYHIQFSMKDMQPFLKIIKVVDEEGMVDYKNFLKMIDPNVRTPEIMPIKDLPESSLYYVTGTQEMSTDKEHYDNSKMPTAGLPSFRTDLERPYKTEGIHTADMDTLPNFTTIKTTINPSIYTRYGLTFRDFFMPRKPEVIRKLFEKIGYPLTDRAFNKLWEEGVAHDETGLCCVDTFKKLIELHFPHRTEIRVDEIDETDCRDVYVNI
ncbi:unnamed protein product [Phyllotreta striolata]|uniref:EFHB C-terminal EF-hand domain-containing protein n=1 Tax=Phyllotreta striolata TaxID=444603 RepID=A0A9N9XMH9_PHYSR|nr:unnamed protein product [Phyllotreta striolata]